MKIVVLLVTMCAATSFAEPCQLIVTTETGDKENAGSDSSAYVRINGSEERHLLDNPGKNDLEAGAKDEFPGIPLTIEAKDIETIHLEFEGEDAWLLEDIHFQVICGTASSKRISFRKKRWLSAVKEDVYSKAKLKFEINGQLAVENAND